LGYDLPKVDKPLLVQVIVFHTLRCSLIWKVICDDAELFRKSTELLTEDLFLRVRPVVDTSMRREVLCWIFDKVRGVVEDILYFPVHR